MVHSDHGSKTVFPTTRYQGSKRRYSSWILGNLQNIRYDSVLDVFGGTGAMSYAFKQQGKQVIYNDILQFNHFIGKAVIENSYCLISKRNASKLIIKKEKMYYPSFISKHFKDIYFLDNENEWLDIVKWNIFKMKESYEKYIAFFALFQSCLIKRPYNLFHRDNLFFRTKPWKKTMFGNKITWERSFEYYFFKFIQEANSCIFSNNKNNLSINYNLSDIPKKYYCDLVYLDPPYRSINVSENIDYLSYYHFLEGLTMDNRKWLSNLSYERKGKPISKLYLGEGPFTYKKINLYKNKFVLRSVWSDNNEIEKAFDTMCKQFEDSIIVVSYRNPGVPSKEKIIEIDKDEKGYPKQKRVYRTPETAGK